MNQAIVPTRYPRFSEVEYRQILYVDFRCRFWLREDRDECVDAFTVEEVDGFAQTWCLPVIMDATVWDEVSATLDKLVARMAGHCFENRDTGTCTAAYDAEGEAIIQEIDNLIEDSWERLQGDWSMQHATQRYLDRELPIAATTTDAEIDSMQEHLFSEALDAHVVVIGVFGHLVWLRQKAKNRAARNKGV